jgi:hypothetical protein
MQIAEKPEKTLVSERIVIATPNHKRKSIVSLFITQPFDCSFSSSNDVQSMISWSLVDDF